MSMYNLSILFWLRKDLRSEAKNDTTIPVAIYCRVTVNGQKVEISTGEKVLPDRWKNQSVTGNKEDAKTTNHRLDIMKDKIKKIFNKLCDRDEIITPAIIKQHLDGKIDDIRNKTLKQAFDIAIKEMEELTQTGHQKSVTTRRYKITYNNVKAFIKEKYGKGDIYLRDLITRGKVEFSFAKDYEHWGKTSITPVQGLVEGKPKPKPIWMESYCKKELVRINTILNIVITKGWLERNPFDNITKTAKGPKKEKWLTEGQLNIIKSLTLVKESLQEVLDIFIFQCYTGLAYAEVRSLAPEHLTFGLHGYNWIFTSRVKTIDSSGKQSQIILVDEALAIIKKYKDHPLCVARGTLLPVDTNQAYNRDLKIILGIANEKGAGIKNLTTHTPRHTAATLLRERGLPDSFVAEMFGHATTKLIGTVYGGKTPKILATEMNIVKLMEQDLNK